ncbi:MAG TPA: 23S rRNA (uracil(1939)-C(5))-methyltransferase RlmD [Gammaproteobacteria bacterium]
MGARQRLPKDPVEITIDSLSHDGRGVGHVDGKAVFVEGALPGEQVRFCYTARHRRYDEGRVVDVVKSSPDRVEPRCKHFQMCGGCSLQHLSPMAQILAKQDILLDNLQRIGHVVPARVLEPLQAEVWHYRDKARLSVRYVKKKNSVLVGFREKRSSYVTETEQCEVLNGAVGRRIAELRALIESLSIREFIPQVEVAAGDAEVCLIFRILQPLPAEDESVLMKFGEKHGFTMRIQPEGPDSIYTLGDLSRPLHYNLPDWGIRVFFGPGDFTQVNMSVNRRMLSLAMSLLDVEQDDTVLDLFCGLGNFSLPLARRVKHVVGIEGEASMVARAAENARANSIENAQFYAADLFQDPPGASGWLANPYTKVLLDPPRSGAYEVVQWLPRKLLPHKIVYVSCNPATLARDADILVNHHGYRLRDAGVMDMFPHTAHVEAIALFER